MTGATFKDQLRKLILCGHCRRLPHDRWNTLSEEDAECLVREALRVPPLTFAPASTEQKNLLRSYCTQNLLPGVYNTDLPALTAPEAETLIAIAEDNRWTAERRYSKIVEKTAADNEPASPEELKKIIELAKERRLNFLSFRTLLKITHLSTRRLIWRGEMNKREGIHGRNP